MFAINQAQDHIIDAAMNRLVEMFRLQKFAHLLGGFIIHQHCPQKRLLDFQIARRLPIIQRLGRWLLVGGPGMQGDSFVIVF
jgi:hypothetical protein